MCQGLSITKVPVTKIGRKLSQLSRRDDRLHRTKDWHKFVPKKWCTKNGVPGITDWDNFGTFIGEFPYVNKKRLLKNLKNLPKYQLGHVSI